MRYHKVKIKDELKMIKFTKEFYKDLIKKENNEKLK